VKECGRHGQRKPNECVEEVESGRGTCPGRVEEDERVEERKASAMDSVD